MDILHKAVCDQEACPDFQRCLDAVRNDRTDFCTRMIQEDGVPDIRVVRKLTSGGYLSGTTVKGT